MSRWLLPAIAAGVGLGFATLLGSRSSAAASAPRTPPTPLPASTHIETINGRSVLLHFPDGADGTRIVLYFHGNGAKIAELQTSLIPALGKAKRPAIIVIPQLEAHGDPGTLGNLGAIKALLIAALPTGVDLSKARIDILAHSGGYLAAAATLNRGELVIRAVGLLDALYGHADTFGAFAIKPTTEHFANVYGPSTAAQSLALSGFLATALGDRAVLDIIGSEERIESDLSHHAATIRTVTPHGAVPVKYGAAMLNAFES